MGFLDTALGLLAGAAGGFVAGGPAGAIAGGLGSLGGLQTPALATGGVTAGAITPAVVTALATQSPQEIARANAVLAAGLQPTGLMKNMVQTIVQTIAPNGSIVRSTILKGRPFLMNSDFVVLKRTLKLIGIAEDRIPRPRTRGTKAKVEQAHTQGMIEGLVSAGNPTARLLAHHASD